MAIADFVSQYTAHGFSIIPLVLRNKTPAIGSWKIYQERRPQKSEIDAWFRQDYNIGIVCGKVSGYLSVIDFDTPDLVHPIMGKSIEELNSWTMVVQTGKGYHVYLQDKGHTVIRGKNFREQDAKLSVPIDFKSEGGYVVAPPSIHPSGAEYRLLNNLAPREMDVDAMFTDFLVPRCKMYSLARIVEPYYVPSQASGGSEPAGTRHDFALHLTTYLRYKYKFTEGDVAMLFEILGIIQSEKGIQPHDPRDLERIVDDVYKQEQGQVPVGTKVDDKLLAALNKYASYFSKEKTVAHRDDGIVLWRSRIKSSDNEETWISCRKDGLKLIEEYEGQRKSSVTQTEILSNPIELIDAWRIRNFIKGVTGADKMEFEFAIGGDIYHGGLIDIVTQMTNHCPYVVDTALVKDAVHHCANHYIGSGIVKVNSSYPAVGVFSDPFEIVLPDDINKPIRVAEGSEAERFKLLYSAKAGDMLQTLRVYAGLGRWFPREYFVAMAGWAAMAPFYFMLKSIGDFYTSMVIAMGSRSTGKTSFCNLFSTWLYGGVEASSDDITTAYRISDLWASTTFPRFIDEAEKVNLNAVISNSSISDILKKGLFTQIARRVGTIGRQNVYYPSFAALLLAGNRVEIMDAALLSRAVTLNFSILPAIKDVAKRKAFQDNVQAKITRAVGIDLCRRILSEYPTISTMHDAIVREASGLHIDLMDARRIDIYATIRLGIRMWDRMFTENGIESPFTDMLDDRAFSSMMQHIENQNVEAEQEVNELSGFVSWLMVQASAMTKSDVATTLQVAERRAMIQVTENSPITICFTQSAIDLYTTTMNRRFPVSNLSGFADRYSELTGVPKIDIYNRDSKMTFGKVRMKYAKIRIEQQDVMAYSNVVAVRFLKDGGGHRAGDEDFYDRGMADEMVRQGMVEII